MESFYTGPGRPGLALGSWQDVESAVQVGATRETQWFELKLDVPASASGANTELAKDLASLTVDGGLLVIGIRDGASEAADVVGVDESAVAGLSSRIDQIAHSRVSPPMHVQLHPIIKPDGSGRTILVVEVPPSASAPHMVDNRYWGRSATGKRPLTDDEVARLFARRSADTEQFTALLSAMPQDIDPLPLEQRRRGRLYVMAQPLIAPGVALTDVIGDRLVLQLALTALHSYPPQWSTGLRNLRFPIPHPDGVAAATDAVSEWVTTSEDYLTFVLLRDDGTVQYVSGDAVRTWNHDGPTCISFPGICEAVQQVAAIAGHLATDYLRYSGQWRLGLLVTGLHGLYPSQHFYPSRSSAFTPFQTETYQRVTVVSREQLLDPSSAVVETVAADLARGLSLGWVFPYANLRELASRFR